MYALISFSGHKFHSVEVAQNMDILKTIVSKRERGEVEWVDNGGVLTATSLAGPLITYRIQKAAVR